MTTIGDEPRLQPEIVASRELDELGFCSRCRRLLPLHVTTFKRGSAYKDRTYVNFHECEIVQAPAILVFGPDRGWISFTVGS